MAVLDGDEIVYVVRVPTKRIMAAAISVGTRFPAYATSMGRALLAHLSEDQLEEYLKNVHLEPLTNRTVTSSERLGGILVAVRTQGYAMTDQELEEGLRSAAVPIRDASGTVVAAMNVSTHASRVSMEELRRNLLPLLIETAGLIEADLGARPGTKGSRRRVRMTAPLRASYPSCGPFGGTDPGRALWGGTGRRPAGRPGGARHTRSGRPLRCPGGRDRGRLFRRCQPGRRRQPQRRPHGGTVGRVTRSRSGGHGEQALRVRPFRHRQRLSCGDVRRGRPVCGRRRGVDVAGPVHHGQAQQRLPRGNRELYDTTLGWRFPNPRLAELFPLESMGETGENVADEYGVSRQDQDAFALESHRRWAQAATTGLFADEIVAVDGTATDEHPRSDTTLEKLAALKPAFRDNGTVTAGNSSGINDGAAAVVIASEGAGGPARRPPSRALRRQRGRRRRPPGYGHRARPGHSQAHEADGSRNSRP